jgi:hypothetical protein
MPDENKPTDERLTQLNKLLVKVLKDLACAGRRDAACTFAAEAWSLLRHETPKEAERMNGLLHYLTAPAKTAETPSHAS